MMNIYTKVNSRKLIASLCNQTMTSSSPPSQPSSPENSLTHDLRAIILNFLPTVDAAVCTFISKDWTPVFSNRPFLAIHEADFMSHPFCTDRVFTHFISWLFRKHNSEMLRHLFIQLEHCYDQNLLTNCFGYLVNPCKLKTIQLFLCNSKVPLPLILTNKFCALERLILQEVDLSFTTKTSIRFPALLTLRIIDCVFQSDITVSVEMPLLKCFGYIDPYDVKWHASILEVDAPRLLTVYMINGVRGKRFDFAKRCSVLEEASVESFLDSTYNPRNSLDYSLHASILLRDFNNVNRLTLSAHMLQILVNANWAILVFLNLEHMSIFVWETYGSFESLINLLSRCPRIKKLIIQFEEVDGSFQDDRFGITVDLEEFDLPQDGIWAARKSLNLVVAANPNLGETFMQCFREYMMQIDLLAEDAFGHVSHQ